MEKNKKYPKDYDKEIDGVKKPEKVDGAEKPSVEELRESESGYPTATGPSKR